MLVFQDLVLQYEVQVRGGSNCGGAYVKVSCVPWAIGMVLMEWLVVVSETERSGSIPVCRGCIFVNTASA